ncbi:MAG: Uma2 family endonuclease [Acidobacteriota bacterium]|nr:Uma2 family endonuclease [Acidobacteriota bacterium]
MGTLILSPPVSIEEYLFNPAYQHSEYFDGEVQPLNVGTRFHARIQGRCFRKLDEYLDARPGNYVGTELHCRLLIDGKVRFRLPDLAVVLGGFSEDYLDRGPDLAVEIRSPEDSIVSQLRKIDDYFLNGTKLAWLILPEEQSVLVLVPHASPRTLVAGDTLDGGDLLPDLRIPVADLFC